MSQVSPTVTVAIDDRSVTVPKGTTVYHAAHQVGIEIPIFCYHDRMPPLGACRMCLVHVEKIPKLQTACTLEAADGMVVRTATPEVITAQQAILEQLLINHPLDCPICDKGGECPLQDQTYRFGPGRSRFVETKRDFAKPVALGSVLVLDRERCILCWRCVRFGELIAGDDALKGFERGFHSEINTPFTLPVQSKFIGNTITICPVGALTAKPYRFIARPWDNRAVPSICTHCGVGCAVWLDVRDAAITRVHAREQKAVNDIWLCDLGFFGYAYVGHPDRLRHPLVRRESGLVESTWSEALDLVARRLQAGARVGMLGGARLTNEDAFVIGRFFRTVVGTNDIDHRIDTQPASPSMILPWGMTSAIEDIVTADVVVLVGCDITEEYPVLWLRMKQALDRGAKIIAVTPKALEVGRLLTYQLVHRYGQGAAVLDALFQAMQRELAPAGEVGGVSLAAVMGAAKVLAGALRPLLMIGKLALDAPDGWGSFRAMVEIGGRMQATISVMRGKGNAFGAALAGLVPNAGPGGRPLEELREDLERLWGTPLPAKAGMDAPTMLDAAARGDLDVLYVISADPATDVPDRGRWMAARARLPFLVVQDAFLTETAQQADVVLPALVMAEKDGTVSNIEGRVQEVHAAVPGPGEARSDWQIMCELAHRLGRVITYAGWEEIFADMQVLIPGLSINERVRSAHVPISGVGIQQASVNLNASSARTLDYPLTLFSGQVLFDRGSMTSRCAAIADLAGEPWALIHPADAARYSVSAGDVVVLSSPRDAVAVRAQISTAILPGHVYLPRGFDGIPANALTDGGAAAAAVRIGPLVLEGGPGVPPAAGDAR